MTESVLIVGVGSGLSASLARLCSKKNMVVNLAARNIDKLKALKEETNANTYQCDSTNKESVSNLFKELDNTIGTPNLVIYNAAARVRGSGRGDKKINRFVVTGERMNERLSL